MKSTLKLFAMLMLVTFMASCSEGSDELGTTQPTGKKVYMTFSGSTDATLRTVINSEDNSKIDFAAGDAISVFDVNGNQKFTTEAGGNIAEFGGYGTPSNGYTLLYPHQADASISDGKVNAVIPATQIGVEKTFDPAANLSIAKADRENAFKLLNVCSLIRFNVVKDCKFITLTDVKGRAVAGAITINPATGEAEAVTGASKSVVLTDVKANTVYYIALLPGKITLSLKFETTDGKSFVRTKNDEIDLDRSKVLNIGKITATDEEMTQEWVDLDLPSGTLWATCNIGATSPEGYGDYYAWGEIETKTSYAWEDYKYGTTSSKISKYNDSDKKTILEAADDIAFVALGSNWRMPKENEFSELINNTNKEWTDDYNGTGVKGEIFRSKIDDTKYIFFPAAGYCDGTSKSSTSEGRYWSSTLHSQQGSGIRFLVSKSSSPSTSNALRHYGMLVRAVKCINEGIDNGHKWIKVNGIKWATCNVGAKTETECGDYFAWGQTEPYYSSISISYDKAYPDVTSVIWKSGKESGYIKANYPSDISSYYDATTKILKPEYDAATVNWGPNWRMPTSVELQTIANLGTTYRTYTTIDGVSGRKVVDKDDATKYIFLPAAGFANEDGFTISGSGKYASSTLTTSDVSEFYLDFTSTSCLIKSAGCYVGRTIRPVYIGE